MPALEVYKPDVAAKSRWILGASAAALLFYGCFQLFYALPAPWRGHMFGELRPLGEEFPISVALTLSIGLGIASAYGIWRAVNFARLVDFFAETEIEMTKVSWASAKEVRGSSAVVVATVVILGVWMFLVDILLRVVMPPNGALWEALRSLFAGPK